MGGRVNELTDGGHEVGVRVIRDDGDGQEAEVHLQDSRYDVDIVTCLEDEFSSNFAVRFQTDLQGFHVVRESGHPIQSLHMQTCSK